MDFGALPPEVNSARMYAGAGAAGLVAAAAAWNGIAVELSTAASCFESIVTRLGTEPWLGPASLSMAAAAQPLVAWLTGTAESSALAAAQAMASAAAFEAGRAMTVAPAEVAANRAQLAQLVATNILGHNMPAIAAVEARYGELWAQDAAAMYGYAAASAAAGRLNPLIGPSAVTNPAGIAGQAAAVGQAAASGSAQRAGLDNLISNLPNAVMSLASSAPSEGQASGLNAVLSFLTNPNPLFVDHAWHGVSGVIADFDMALTTSNDRADAAIGVTAGGAGSAAAATAARPVTSAGVGATPIVAGLGTASSVGRLSVPASWSTAAPAVTADIASAGAGWAVPEEDAAIAVVPPAPGMVVADNGAGAGAGPRYGVKPTVMPRHVFG
ncbi:MAG: PPE family protein [Mycobacterium pseudokansasii]|uniref:PPE family protein PPE15 n=1 Tax=Mycobacterium pseudokansasii TaxID=2341080 RepID=A0A498QR39_9MYCO|nr:PPE family protein [Mycobacterium pseudokansasii]KZS59307.1 hypothetical protein A4G27_24255 [Mycobacterium kansasii]MBY0390792.1 PPE family protein [Mycobacterium pseudokansasii]VAZ93070.1 PPE family protein PPE15 [Mycobacterium pseudokansasii]VAZ94050.1 PPE family protein PPE15 [Mycobacterium pseudokansasii]VBA49571.1 PPE family protein PPE15 [Mycobacterium pseudokansasii]